MAAKRELMLLLISINVLYSAGLNFDWSVLSNLTGLPEAFEKEIDNFLQDGGVESDTLNKYLDDAFSKTFLKIDKTSNYDGLSWVTCPACETVAYALLSGNWNGLSQIVLRKFLIKTCSRTLYSKTFCEGVIDLNMPIFLYIADNNKELTPKTVCAIIAQPVCGDIYQPPEWSIDVHENVNKPNYPQKKKSNSEPLTIIHLTDLHYDPKYSVGSNAECTNFPLCCRSDSDAPESPDQQAGLWGDYRQCDCPYEALEDAFQQVKNNHPKIDYIYFTGDIVSHNVWDTTKEQINDSIRLIYNMFQEYFSDIPMYPILGNHEPQPLDVFAPLEIDDSKFTTKWLFDLTNEVWSPWLPSSTKETVSAGGFYSVLVKPGFRIIGVNSNVAYIYNWWLLYNAKDPYGQLQWLSDELFEAEKNNEIVHILSHVPVGDPTAEKMWSREYRKVINRFSHIIAGHFNGHTHYDELKIFYDNSDPLNPKNVAFTGGSINTWMDVNPNYRVFTVDPDTYELLDYEQWIYNLTEANSKSGNPRWYKLYSFKEEYQVPSLRPNDIHDLVKRMVYNPSLVRKYISNKGKNADPYNDKHLNGCDFNCLFDEICKILTTQYFDDTQCDLIVPYDKKKCT